MSRAIATDVQAVRRSDSNIGLPLQLLADLRVYGERAASRGPHFLRSRKSASVYRGVTQMKRFQYLTGGMLWGVPCLMLATVLLQTAPAQTAAREDGTSDVGVPHAECTFFGEKREEILRGGLGEQLEQMTQRSSLTSAVVAALSARRPPSRSRAAGRQLTLQGGNSVDDFVFNALRSQGIPAAPPTTDAEFLRRVTLDLTGRIPTPNEVVSFLGDSSPDKRKAAVDRLLASPPWADRWAMFFGDLYRNTLRTSQVNRYVDGRDAFHLYLLESMQQNKPYDQMAREILSASGQASGRSFPESYASFEAYRTAQRDYNSYPVNATPASYIVGGRTTGGPIHDTYDTLTAFMARDFLGITHMDCLLCHDGAGHLDSLSAWGEQATRLEAWGLASFFSRTRLIRPLVPPPEGRRRFRARYWIVSDRPRGSYRLNTTTGNRPERLPGANRGVALVTPAYLAGGGTPDPGESYRQALGRLLTADKQFARAIVNYIWKEFFSRGLVDPPDQFDLARLDAANPPAQPWTVQPSHPELLDFLADGFVENGFDLKWLMRRIANSDSYQLSSRYEGTWNPAYGPTFARFQVRRLTAEEIHDALVTSSGVPIGYPVSRTIGAKAFAMQFPDVQFVPIERRRNDRANSFAAIATQFLNDFFRGDREETPRSGEASIMQALQLMNSPLVVARINESRMRGTLAVVLDKPDDVLVQSLYLLVLSRPATPDELATAVQLISSGDREQNAEDLMWSLYNKVDFIFNY